MNKKGFTLIELMLVVVILGILVGMVVPRLTGRSQEARIAAARADIYSSISLALDLYELDNGAYPSGLADLLKKVDGKGPYLKKKALDPWKKEYKYKSPGDHNKDDYDLYSAGPDGKEGTSDDVTNWEEETTQ